MTTQPQKWGMTFPPTIPACNVNGLQHEWLMDKNGKTRVCNRCQMHEAIMSAPPLPLAPSTPREKQEEHPLAFALGNIRFSDWPFALFLGVCTSLVILFWLAVASGLLKLIIWCWS